jgi:hypothetical protein
MVKCVKSFLGLPRFRNYVREFTFQEKKGGSEYIEWGFPMGTHQSEGRKREGAARPRWHGSAPVNLAWGVG